MLPPIPVNADHLLWEGCERLAGARVDSGPVIVTRRVFLATIVVFGARLVFSVPVKCEPG